MVGCTQYEYSYTRCQPRGRQHPASCQLLEPSGVWLSAMNTICINVLPNVNHKFGLQLSTRHSGTDGDPGAFEVAGPPDKIAIVRRAILGARLAMVDSAEDLLRNLGFRELRVRKDRDTARIEIPEADIPRLLDAALRRKITTSLLEIGFKYITLDLEGFSSGKLNRVIPIVPSIPASGGTLVAAPSHVAG